MLDTLVETPAVGCFDLVLERIEPRQCLGCRLLGHRHHRGMVVDQQAGGVAQAVGHGRKHVALEIEVGLLWHIGRHQPGFTPHDAVVQRGLAGHCPQQAGLARAVAPDQRHTFTGVELEGNLVEQVDMAEGKTGVFYGQQRHGVKSAGSRPAADNPGF